MNTIYIRECGISMGQYLLYTLKEYMKSWWWAYVLPLALCVFLSMVNINFIFVAVILFFLVFTMILFFVVIYYGIVPECRYSTLRKNIQLCDDGIILHLKKPVSMVDEDSGNEQDDTNKESDIVIAQKYVIEEVLIKWRNIKQVKGTDECLLLVFKKPRYSFFAIPYEAFDGETHLKETLSMIRFNLR
ncbi:MAG: hypothetical protein E7080_09190 [Bacteroidales bacterium]|nr:hypothetical protein [Bacteroidales bacterium]